MFSVLPISRETYSERLSKASSGNFGHIFPQKTFSLQEAFAKICSWSALF